VFMKGCPLRCQWCHNPEGLRFQPEVIWHEEKCCGCLDCLAICSRGAIRKTESGLRTDFEQCTVCGACVDTCPTGARELVGRVYTVSEVIAELERDRIFYDQSDGGITVSGGEPLSQAPFVARLFSECRAIGLHTALDTSGLSPFEALEAVLKETDLVLFDLKHPDREVHKQFCGVDPQIIFDNLEKIGKNAVPIWIRIPFIPGVNDSEEVLGKFAKMISSVPGLQRVDLLPYHPLGRDKYRRFNLDYQLGELASPSLEVIEQKKLFLRNKGLPVS
jgi:pyruvate formate lyase activating enzyme